MHALVASSHSPAQAVTPSWQPAPRNPAPPLRFEFVRMPGSHGFEVQVRKNVLLRSQGILVPFLRCSFVYLVCWPLLVDLRDLVVLPDMSSAAPREGLGLAAATCDSTQAPRAPLQMGKGWQSDGGKGAGLSACVF